MCTASITSPKLNSHPSIQNRLIEANLIRRHRFKEAQRHSGGLKDHSGSVSSPVIPQQFITKSRTWHKNQDISPLQDQKIAALAKIRYPQAQKLSNVEQKLVKCPCRCQAIPATELESSRWRYIDPKPSSSKAVVLNRTGYTLQTNCVHTLA